MRPLSNAALRPPAGLPEGMYAAVADGGSAALVVHGAGKGLRIVWANAAALDLLGLAPDEVIGADLGAIGNEALDGPTPWPTLAAAGITRQRAPIDALDIDDAARWIDAVAEGPGRTLWPVQVKTAPAGADFAVIWLRSTAEAQRIAEEAQRESEHRFRALAEHAPVGIVVSEAGLRLGFVNARFAEITGIDQSIPVSAGCARCIRMTCPRCWPWSTTCSSAGPARSMCGCCSRRRTAPTPRPRWPPSAVRSATVRPSSRPAGCRSGWPR